MKVGFIIPVFNDWEALQALLSAISEIQGIDTEYFIIDDCSTEANTLSDLEQPARIIELNQNVGHQRAIALGLCYANEHFSGDAIIIMDGDGEDRPEDINTLIASSNKNSRIVFVKRKKRQEGILFRIFYSLYKLAFTGLTGKRISFGNYSIIPRDYIKKVIHLPDIWNHYSGAVVKSRLPFETVSLNKGNRYSDKSKMDFYALIVHGFSSFSIYSEVIAARVIVFTLFLLAINLSLIMVVFYRKFIADIASPGWATTSILGLTIVSLQFLLFSFMVGLLVLDSRKQGLNTTTTKYYKDFINRIYEV